MSRSKLEADASIVTLLELPEVAMRLWPLSTNLNSEEEMVPVNSHPETLTEGQEQFHYVDAFAVSCSFHFQTGCDSPY